jgi:peptide/nickel transport system ATP-binding protein
VRDLAVSFDTPEGIVQAVRGVSYEVCRGETLGIVGESGAGKSVSVLTLLDLIPRPPARIERGVALWRERDLLRQRPRDRRRVRGREIAMLFQDPSTALHPSFRILDQIVEALHAHRPGLSPREAYDRANELLELVDLRPERGSDYPHEWSGGMQQRAMIAIAMANDPELVIADEPTTALDVTTQAQILDVLRRVQAETGTSILLITHDLGVIAEMADRVAVMYAGRIVETGGVDDIFHRPRHPFTLGLLSSLPRLRADEAHRAPIPGHPPHPLSLPTGCAFHPRCRLGSDRAVCLNEDPPLRGVDDIEHRSACHFASEVHPALYAEGAGSPARVSAARGRSNPAAGDAGPRPKDELLRIEDLAIRFGGRGGLGFRRRATVTAVDGVSFSLAEGETLGIVGRSGSGKSTLARAIARLRAPSAGTIWFDGRDITGWNRRRLRAVRRELQIVFQNPQASLNPRRTVGEIVALPLRIHSRFEASGGWGRVAQLLERVGLRPEIMSRFPHQLSGGQMQLVSIARALALDPRLIVLDEPTSSLDASIRGRLVRLLDSLQADLGLAYLFITHDLSILRELAHRIAVMQEGRIVEIGEAAKIYDHPGHPYTQSLLSSIPVPDPRQRRYSRPGPGRS